MMLLTLTEVGMMKNIRKGPSNKKPNKIWAQDNPVGQLCYFSTKIQLPS